MKRSALFVVLRRDLRLIFHRPCWRAGVWYCLDPCRWLWWNLSIWRKKLQRIAITFWRVIIVTVDRVTSYYPNWRLLWRICYLSSRLRFRVHQSQSVSHHLLWLCMVVVMANPLSQCAIKPHPIFAKCIAISTHKNIVSGWSNLIFHRNAGHNWSPLRAADAARFIWIIHWNN